MRTIDTKISLREDGGGLRVALAGEALRVPSISLLAGASIRDYSLSGIGKGGAYNAGTGSSTHKSERPIAFAVSGVCVPEVVGLTGAAASSWASCSVGKDRAKEALCRGRIKS